MDKLKTLLSGTRFHIGQTWGQASVEILDEHGEQVLIGSVARATAWAKANFPMIDPSQTYTTRDGKRVIGLQVVARTSAGFLATFPVKGTVVVREKPWRTKFRIWTLEGTSEDPTADLILAKQGPEIS